MSATARVEPRVRPRGHGHRQRISEAKASRASMYETIEEEVSNASSPPTSPHVEDHSAPDDTRIVHNSAHRSSVFVVDADTGNLDSPSMWDDENGITQLRRYYTLREEAEDTVMHSKQVWLDTLLFPSMPFSVSTFCTFKFLLLTLTKLSQPSFRPCRPSSSTLWRITALFLLNSVASGLERSLDHPLIPRLAPLKPLSLRIRLARRPWMLLAPRYLHSHRHRHRPQPSSKFQSTRIFSLQHLSPF